MVTHAFQHIAILWTIINGDSFILMQEIVFPLMSEVLFKSGWLLKYETIFFFL